MQVLSSCGVFAKAYNTYLCHGTWQVIHQIIFFHLCQEELLEQTALGTNRSVHLPC
jgi:hypothetical protein